MNLSTKRRNIAKEKILNRTKQGNANLQENAIPAVFLFIIRPYRVFSLNHTSIENSGWIRRFHIRTFASLNIRRKGYYTEQEHVKVATKIRAMARMKFFPKIVKLRILRQGYRSFAAKRDSGLFHVHNKPMSRFLLPGSRISRKTRAGKCPNSL